MNNANDFGALNWVKDELDETIRQARRALESYVESEGDDDRLVECADHLHQIAGVLQMVQIYGPGMLAEEMEEVTRALSDGRVRQREDAAEALMLALIQLPDYLEKLQGGDVDVPLIILPLLNDLRAVREAPLLSEAALFKPEIEATPVPQQLTGKPNPELPSLVRHLRQKFHLGLLAWYRKHQIEKGWQNLQEVFDELEKNAGTQQVYRLAWVGGALIRGLIEGSITSGIAIKQLFGKVDRQLKQIIDQGETALAYGQADDLLKNLLYYIAQADSDDPKIKEVKHAYDLDAVLPSEADLAKGRQGLTGSNAELAASISEAIHTELTRVKDVLDLFMRNQQADTGMLEHLAKPMRQLADTLGMIGQGALRSRLLRQADKIQSFIERSNPPEEFELMEMAGDILFVESSLSTLQSAQTVEEEASDLETEWGLKLPEGEYANLIKQTVREAKVDIAKAKEAIIGYTESPNEPQALADVHEGFLRVYGALKMLEMHDASKILQSTTEFIQSRMIDGHEMPARQQLNSLADVISSIEYFLEALVDGAGDRREILSIAQTALNGLLVIEPTAQRTEAGVIPITGESRKETDSSQQTADFELTQVEIPGQPKEPVVVEDASVHEIPIPSSEKPALEDIDAEILEIFIEEAREELETIQHDLPAWQKNQDDKNALISFRRSFHTLKGSGRLVGAKIIGELGWSVENMLNRLIDETIKVTPEMMALLDDVLRMLPVLIDSQEKGVVPDVDVEGLVQRAFTLAGGRHPSNLGPATESKPVVSAPAMSPFGQVQSVAGELTLSEPVDQLDIGTIDSEISEISYEPDEELIESNPLDELELGQNELQGFSDSDFTIELDTELLEVFGDEAEDHLQELEGFLAQIKLSDSKLQVSDEAIRACHTLHGSARMTGMTPIADLSHAIEDYLKTLAGMNQVADKNVISLLEGAIKTIRNYLHELPNTQQSETDTDSYLERLAGAQAELLSESIVGLEESEAKDSPKAESELSVQDVLQDLDLYEVDEDPELVEIFVEEAKELLQSIQPAFTGWLEDRDNVSLMEPVLRGMHTLKGSARLAGVAPVGDLSQALEKVFTAMTEGRVPVTPQLMNVTQDSLQKLSAQIEEVESKSSVHWADTDVDQLEAMLEVPETFPEGDLPEVPVDLEATTEPVVDELLAADTDEVTASEFYSEPLSFLHDDDSLELDADPELLEVFVEEANELLEDLRSSYRSWSSETGNLELINRFQRILHTLKGSSRLAGVLPVGDLSQALEGLFNDLAEGPYPVSKSLLELAGDAMEMLAHQVHEAESVGRVRRADSLIQQLEAMRQETLVEDIQIDSLLSEEIEEAEHPLDEMSDSSSASVFTEPVSFLQEGALVDVGDDPELVEVFTEEAREFIDHLESGFQRWEGETDNLSLIDDMQRSLHTLKGSARLAGITPVGDLSHAVESLLTGVSEGEVSVTDNLLGITRQALDKLATQLDEISQTGMVSLADDLVRLLAETQQPEVISWPQEPAEQVTQETKPVEAEEPLESAVVLPFVSEIAKRAVPRKDQTATPFTPSKDQVRINADLMDRLVNYAGEVSIYRARQEQQNNVLGFNLAELEQTVSRLFTQLRNLEMETEAQILYRWERETDKHDRDKKDFDPLELDRFSTMQQLSRALVETVNDLGNINEALTDLQRETDTLLLQQSRISTDLQDGLLRTRMVPFVHLVPRMQRLVRQTADQLDKKAHLECFGSEGELDRNILNRMIPVLEHLLRNAVSHGIESPTDRQAAEKDETGRLSLYIDREATDVLITLSDDGKGLDIEAIRTQAIAQGMINAQADVSDDDLIQCVLNPGFSTAKKVTQIAGRGVGLDVVASEVKQLGGSLDIDSQPGRGTSFTIRLPLTLAITNALLVRVGEEVYAIPHGNVEGVVRIRHKELQACYSGNQDSYKYASRSYKTAYLGRMMGAADQIELSEGVKWHPLMLIHAGEHHAALQVDELLGTRQIVVKSLGKQVGSVRWITGGTILADGRVAMILDLRALVRMDAAQAASPVTVISAAKTNVEVRKRVMVVDDSITVRKVTGRLLERNNMDVITAKDGVEAVALLQEQVPDIMLLDIEMPRMDGFDLARHINNSVDYYGLPIIMISSRVGEKHRKRAFELGVKRCLGKPYQETELLENINEVLAEVKA